MPEVCGENTSGQGIGRIYFRLSTEVTMLGSLRRLTGPEGVLPTPTFILLELSYLGNFKKS